jgi:hypothetical protein
MEKRIGDVGDLWSDLLKSKKSLRKPIEKVEELFEQEQ